MQKKNPKVIFLIVLLICSSAKLNAQIKAIDSLANQLGTYALKNKTAELFIHFDKNIYTNNDRVWFTGYLLKTATDLERYTTLYLSLISNQDSSVILHKKFLIEKGFVFGNMILPDSIFSGNYRFVASTNVKFKSKPDVEFIQQVSIKSTIIDPMVPNLSLFNRNSDQTGNGTVLLKVLSSDNRFVSDADVSYTIGRNNNIIKTGKAKTSIIGELMIDYPVDKIHAENNEVSAVIKKKNEFRQIKFTIPIENFQPYRVNFYPEGGYLIEGIKNKIGLEIKNVEGIPIQASAVLCVNDRILDTLNTNSTGLGSFSMIPAQGSKYTIKLLKNSELVGNYQLPKPLSKGTNVKLTRALATNELRFIAESNFKNKVHVVVHDFQNIFLFSDLNLDPKIPTRVILKLESVPKGLNAITILDSLYNPIAERIFFAHYDEISRFQINLDKESYSTRDSINLNLKILGKDDTAFNGLVSIALVQKNRLALVNKKNIVDYAYLENELNPLPQNLLGVKYDDEKYLEDILLIKGWRKFKWPEEKESLSNEEKEVSEYEYVGKITRNKKPLSKVVSVQTFAGYNINSFNTDSTGRFLLPTQALLAEDNTKVWLTLSDQKYAGYTIKLTDPSDEIKSIQKNIRFQQNTLDVNVIPKFSEQITSVAGIKLNEVNIKKTKDTQFGFNNAVLGVNSCGDYVCVANILNCQNHMVGTMPVKGKSYYSNGRMIVYAGCSENEDKPNFVFLNKINVAKEFYMADLTNKNEPINFPTLYWNYQFQINKAGQNSLKFTTGDLIGDFDLIIQGISENGVVYGEKTIQINKP
ncbi:hypothetical protein DHW03_05325 [Pedobacter yonginense]|uniref:Carboxypeptidase regulatory-like domain-containing protein n=1 Tax=Pedobacter yonginense TaxID=651869 RepID=A0A317ES45_9SPHI|nr:hypothetical protein [Pedobacter yonginense]PWS29242.1 hypothetical protein DHW03_05325 [Pedobacter yonginense]